MDFLGQLRYWVLINIWGDGHLLRVLDTYRGNYGKRIISEIIKCSRFNDIFFKIHFKILSSKQKWPSKF